MVNVIVFMGVLKEVDSQFKNIRYAHLIQDFKDEKGRLEEVDIPLVNWNRSSKGGIFTFKEWTLLLFKGRVDEQDKKLVILVEETTYLGKA